MGELRSPGQAEAYPTSERALWDMLQLVQRGYQFKVFQFAFEPDSAGASVPTYLAIHSTHRRRTSRARIGSPGEWPEIG